MIWAAILSSSLAFLRQISHEREPCGYTNTTCLDKIRPECTGNRTQSCRRIVYFLHLYMLLHDFIKEKHGFLPRKEAFQPLNSLFH